VKKDSSAASDESKVSKVCDLSDKGTICDESTNGEQEYMIAWAS
jgi:hypothetical protein